MSLRIPVIAAIAVVAASLSLSAVVQGNGWLFGGIGAVIVVAAAGLATRMPVHRAAAVAAALVLVGVMPLLLAPSWPLPVTGLLIIALTAASATGKPWLRAFCAVACYLAALLIYLNLIYSGAQSYGHLIPSPQSLIHLATLVRGAFQQFGYAPPVPDTRQVSLVAAGGIGLIAIMVDVLAVRLRAPAVAGLPLLLLFSVPVASDLKVFSAFQVLVFAAGMAGYLTLLSTAGRQRLRLWGQLVTFRYVQPSHETTDGPDTRELAASGRRIGLAAVCLAVIIPVVLPSVRPHDVFATDSSGSGAQGTGGAAGSAAGVGFAPLPQVQSDLLERKPQPVLTYTTTASDPADQYFQLYVLNYHSRTDEWLPELGRGAAEQRFSAGNGLPYAPQGQLRSTPAVTVTTHVTMNSDQQGSGYLPVPYAPVGLDAASAGWFELPGSLMLFNPAASLAGLHYTVTSSEADPTPAQINNASGGTPSSIAADYGTYTGPDAARLAAIAHQHAGSGTALQQALRLQAWFVSGDFTYSLKPNLPASHWLLKFLTTDRRGYCQQFAWAFAVLARLVGIPSRIAVGYTAGRPGPDGTWQVTTADAHAWPELYLPGEGWLRFEPTPHGTTGQDTATAPAYASGTAGGGAPAATPSASAGAVGPTGAGHPGQPNALNRLQHGASGGAGVLGGAGGSRLWLAILIPVLALLLACSPALTRRLTRRRRWLTAGTDAAAAWAAWQELTDDLTDYGLDGGPGETPRAVARRVGREAHLDPPAAQAMARIVAAAERAQYARLAEPAAALPADVLRVRRAVASSVPVRQRVRALLLPASTLAAAQRVLQRAGDMLGWLDTSWPVLRRKFSRAEPPRQGPPSRQHESARQAAVR